MVIKYDQETDIIYVQLSEYEVYESDEEKPGLIIDYDVNGNIVGIEYLQASARVKDPGEIKYELT